jgi:hypothetical protein
MKDTSLIMKGFTLLPYPLFTGTKGTKVFYCFGNRVTVETEDYASCVFSFDILSEGR